MQRHPGCEGIAVLEPDWPVSKQVRACFTLRTGGVSAPPFDSLNLGSSDDDPEAPRRNKRRLREALALPDEPYWLDQVHGTAVADLDDPATSTRCADAAITRQCDRVCVVRVADCLPVFFAARDGSSVGVAHAGWRGLAAGVIEATIDALAIDPAGLCAHLGPAIGPRHFEVGDEVRRAFLAHSADAARAFTRNARERWQCDLYMLAHQRLKARGIAAVSGGGESTYGDTARYFSYRRDGRTGRMAALIWRSAAA